MQSAGRGLKSAKNIIAECRAERGVIRAKFPSEILPPQKLFSKKVLAKCSIASQVIFSRRNGGFMMSKFKI